MTIISRTKECVKRFTQDFREGRFSEDDGIVLRIWANEMENFGPKHIMNNSQWRDHALDGIWEGHRASCFSSSGRIIYRVIDKEQVEICLVDRITPNHDYSK